MAGKNKTRFLGVNKVNRVRALVESERKTHPAETSAQRQSIDPSSSEFFRECKSYVTCDFCPWEITVQKIL